MATRAPDFYQDRAEAIDRVMQRLVRRFPDLDLKQLIVLEKKKRLYCPRPNCSCYNEETAYETLCEQIDSIDDLLQKPSDTPEPVVTERLAENPLPADADLIVANTVTIEEVDDLFNTICTEFTTAWDDPVNIYPTHRLYPPNRRCDCVRWLIQTFEQLRFTAVRRIFYNFRKHNTLCNAIFCMCIEAKIVERIEMRPVRNSVYPYTDWWWRHVNVLIGRRYVRARKRTKPMFQNREFAQCLLAKQRYEAFDRRLKEKFPKFFGENGKIDPKIFDNPDPGSVFRCGVCAKQFPERYGIGCLTRLDVGGDEDEAGPMYEHFFCRPCVRENLNGSFFLGKMNNSAIGLACLNKECKHIIDPNDVRPYIDDKIRQRLNSRLVEEVLNLATDLAHQETE